MAKAGAVWVDVLPSMRGFTRELRSGSAGAARIVGIETGRRMGSHMVAESAGQFGRRFGGDIRREVARQEPAMRTAFRRAGSGAGQAGADAGRQMANHMVAESTTQFGRRFGGDIQQEMRRQEPALRTAFRRAADPAGQAGGEAGEEFAREFTRDAAGRLRDARDRFAAAGQGAGEGFGSGVEGGGSGRLSGLSGKWSGAMAKAGPWVAAGAVIGGAVLKGVTEAMDKQDTLARFRSQVGEFGPEGERLGKIAGQLYADAYGESLGDVTEALRGVRTNIAGMSNASAEDLKTVTGQVIRLGEVFDEDVGQTSRAVGKMIKTGLAKDATEALDIITAGFQSGANEADDLLDTFSEYSTQFRNMGLSGEQAMGIISQGLRAGARDADVVADAIKEFSIEAVAGSDKIRDAYGELGLNADKMFAALGKGGPEAAKALDITLDKLREVEDPVERNALAVELFGTKAEDLGDALYALDPSEAVKSLGNVAGAAKRVSDEMGETASARLERFKRGIKSAFVETVGGTVLGNLEKLASRLSGVPKWAQQAGDRLRSAFSGGGGPGRINQLANSFGGLGEKLRGLGGTGLQQLEKIGGKLSELFSSIGETVGEFRTKHADRLSNTFDKVSDATRGFSDALGSVADFGGIVLERVGGQISLFIDSVQKIWDLFGGQILDGITSHFDGVIGTIEGAFKTIQGIFQIATGILSGDWGKAWDGIKNVATGVFKFLTSMPRAMLGFLARTVWNLLTKIGGFFKSVFVGIKDGTVRRLREMRDGAMARLQSMRDGAVRRLQAMRDGAVNRIQNMRNAVTSRVQSMRDAVVVRITSLRDRAEAAVQRMRNNIVDRAQNLRDRVTSTIASLRDRVVQSFRNAASGIRSAWSKIEGYTRKPVKFVIQTVYNEGIRGVWNKIADKVPVIPNLGAMPLPRGFQRGGVVDMRGGGVQPGFSRKDNRLALFRDGEGVLVPEAVRSLGANFVHMANRLGDRAGALLTGGKLPGFQFGGIVGAFARKAKGFFAGGFVKALEAAFGPMLDQVTSRFGTGNDFHGVPGKMLQHIFTKATSWLKQFAAELEGGSGKKVVETARKYIGLSGNPNKFTRRMGMNGLPWCAMFVDGVFDEANASKALAPVKGGRAAVWSYRALPRVGRDAAKPGDLALYRGDAGHINIVVGKGAQTIGGNESNSVRLQTGYMNSASSIRRPAFRRGGIVDLAHQDAVETIERLTHPRTLLHRGVTMPGTPQTAPPVLTDRQWRAATAQARGGDGGSTTTVTYNVQPKYTTLDERQLRAITRAEEIRARAGRP